MTDFPTRTRLRLELAGVVLVAALLLVWSVVAGESVGPLGGGAAMGRGRK